jgi:hypothetical protein
MLAFIAVAHAADVAATPAAGTPDAAPAASEWPALYPYQVGPDDPNWDLEVLYAQEKFDDGLKLVKERLAKAPTAQLYWMKIRFMYEIGERFQRTDTSIDKIAWYQQMLDDANAGLKLEPGNLHLRFARGIAMGRLGTTRGVLSSLFMAKDVEADWLAVANSSWKYASLGGYEVLPCDDYHALGIYYRLVPDWWIVQMIAGTRGDLNKAVEYNQKSVQCKPNEIENWKELGASQLCLGQKNGDDALIAAGKQSLQHALTLPAPRSRNKTDQKHSQMLLNDPSLACEYSRDGQQDLDEKKLSSSP